MASRKIALKPSESKRQKILSAAALLFADKGFHASSTKNIASNAGVSEGTVFNQFANKNALLEAIIEDSYQGLADAAQQIMQDTLVTEERFFAMAQHHMATIAANNFSLMRLLAVYFSEHFDMYLDYRNSSIFKHNKNYTQFFDSILKEGIARKEIRADLQLSVARDLFFGGLEYGVRSLLAKGNTNPNTLEKYTHELTSPVWISLKNTEETSIKPNTNLDDICDRLEKVAKKLEEKA